MSTDEHGEGKGIVAADYADRGMRGILAADYMGGRGIMVCGLCGFFWEAGLCDSFGTRKFRFSLVRLRSLLGESEAVI